jgi:hypothetical protein
MSSLTLVIFFIILVIFLISSLKYTGLLSSESADKNTYVLYNGDQWLEYRLGDLYYIWNENATYDAQNLSNHNCEIGRCFPINGKYHQKYFPNSIADRYHRFNTTNGVKNTQALMKAVRSYASDTNFKSKYSFVFHLRIGDVIESNHTQYFRNVNLDNIANYPDIKHVHIIAGMHKKLAEKKSLDFIHQIQKQLLSRNYQVTLVLGKSPDHNVMMAYNTKYIASSGGGYGRLLIEIAVNNGATYISTKF